MYVGKLSFLAIVYTIAAISSLAFTKNKPRLSRRATT